MSAHPALRVLHDEIEARVRQTCASHRWWPCRRGCDACCRRLAAPPRLTRPEWDLVRRALAGLPRGIRDLIGIRIKSLDGAAPPIVCPFLDRDAQVCLIYESRPVACRAYGFYVERDAGLYCHGIHTLVDRGACDTVVWGNAAGVEARLDFAGERIGLSQLFRDAPPSSQPRTSEFTARIRA